MKKSTLVKNGLLCLAATILLAPATGLSAAKKDSLEVSGAVLVDYRSTSNWVDRVTGNLVSGTNLAEILLINVKAPLGGKWNAFARFSAQNAQDPGLYSPDFNALKFGGEDQGTYFDRWGVTYTNGPTRVILGRQDLVLGATTLLYDTRPYVGGTAVQGVRVMNTVGKLSLDAAVVSETEQDKVGASLYSKNLRSLSASYQLSKQFALGAAYAYQTFDGTDWTNRFTATSITYTPPGKFKLIAENITTSLKSKNLPAADPSAWGFVGQYRFDQKNMFTVKRNNTRARTDISGRGGLPSISNGWFLDYTYRFDKNSSVDLIYADRVINTPAKPVENLKRIMFTHLF